MIKPVIIACAFNEQRNIESFLKALSAQTHGEFSLFLIDDGSVDATFSIAHNYIKKHNFSHFNLHKKEHIGKEKCLQEAILSIEDNNTLILITDADCQPHTRWVECMVRKYEESEADMLIGPVVIEDSHPFQATEFLSIEAVTLGSAAVGHPLICGGANMGFTKAAYLKAREYMPGHFSNGGDMYLLEAMKKLKMRIAPVMSNHAIVVTKGAETVAEFISQRTRWAGKAPNYTDWEIIAAGLITVMIQASLIVALIGAFFLPQLLYIWLVKIIIDFIILGVTAYKIEKTKLIQYILPVSIVYPFYVTATLIIAFFRK